MQSVPQQAMLTAHARRAFVLTGLHEQRVAWAKITSASIARRVSRSMSVSPLANRCMAGVSPARTTRRCFDVTAYYVSVRQHAQACALQL